MSDVTININGGNNQILPNATEAVQNFYGDQFADKILSEQKRDEVSLPEAERLSLYINTLSKLPSVSQPLNSPWSLCRCASKSHASRKKI